MECLFPINDFRYKLVSNSFKSRFKYMTFCTLILFSLFYTFRNVVYFEIDRFLMYKIFSCYIPRIITARPKIKITKKIENRTLSKIRN